MKELFLITFAGIQYGIWKDDILSVRSLDALHRIPLSPACIAGIMLEGDHTVTLANLPVCIGYGSTQDIEQGCILLMKEGDGLMGFVVSGELRTQAISAQQVFPLPDYLKTPVFHACAVHDNIPIPLINISELHPRLLGAREDASVDSLRISGVQPLDISGLERINFLCVGGELFAAPATAIEDMAFKPGAITPLPNTPEYVKGITFYTGRLLPVIDLSQRINLRSSSPESLMLLTEMGDASFGLLIDSIEGAAPCDTVDIEPLPFIARTAWLKHVVVRSGELIPLIDLAMMLPEDTAHDEKPIWQRYAPDSPFPENFFKHEVEVVEFSLLGERHALPRSEVEDVISLKPWRALSDAPPIVIGIAEHQGEILPVLDLAMMFGRRSLATPAWRMLLVKNGNFRALVVTETVSEGRKLPPESHRAVPIHLPHNLMYGCYPDGKIARLVLNIGAIAVHFEKSLIKNFIPALSHAMRISPTGVPYAFPGEITSGTPQALVADAPANAHAKVESRTPAETLIQAGDQARAKTIIPLGAEEEPILQAGAALAGITPERGLEQMVDAVKMAHSADARPITPEPIHVTNHEAPAETLSTSVIAPESRMAEAELLKPIVSSDETSNQKGSGESNIMRELSGTETQPLDMAAPSQISQALESPAQETQARKARPFLPRHAEPVQKLEPPSGSFPSTSAADRSQRSAAVPAPDRASAIARPAFDTLHHINPEVKRISTQPLHEEQTSGPWKHRIAYGSITAALIAILFYFLGPSNRYGPDKSVNAPESATTEQPVWLPSHAATMADPVRVNLAKVEAQQAREPAALAKVQASAELEAKQGLALAPAQQTRAQTELRHPINETPARLELVIPKDMPKVDINEYVVVQGDTLWSISKRFTGNPFNYPRIAGENRIANPDLVFPGQKVRLIK